ncbi:hypothetical protein N3K66_001881 [Trichothecium roseum]|uniref:Uncharacterized protein n=1 Tax=Trichothecium roseum TaxID=47278 RepID=A0ACC0V828_9HYPO|nr:hypothetical protein N3K66_001881 [Trichothecium roseum]
MRSWPSANKPRRAHIKSRSGCERCKRRKVKCDEERPACGNCTRRGEECDFSPARPAPASAAATTTSQRGPGSSQNSTPTASGEGRTTTIISPPSTTAALPPEDGDPGLTSLTVVDLELLHHYCISTCHTFSADPAVRNYFLVSVPQLGSSYPYVLHTVLALAAVHQAHFRPEVRRYYYAYARARHTAATSMAAPRLPGISAAEAVPMYCFSIMTMFIAFGSLRDEDHGPHGAAAADDDDDDDDGGDLIPSWLALFRGVRTVLESNDRAIYSSSISFLFASKDINRTWATRQSDIEALVEFHAYIRGSASQEDEETQKLLDDAFQDLRRALYLFYGEDNAEDAKVRSLFTWMYKVQDGFLALLKARHPKALCVLAFFCVILHRLEYNWWFQGWGTHLIERLYATLDDGHRLWIRWPIQQIGWIPKRDTTRMPTHTVSSSAA